jgi:hypothetical protein
MGPHFGPVSGSVARAYHDGDSLVAVQVLPGQHGTAIGADIVELPDLIQITIHRSAPNPPTLSQRLSILTIVHVSLFADIREFEEFISTLLPRRHLPHIQLLVFDATSPMFILVQNLCIYCGWDEKTANAEELCKKSRFLLAHILLKRPDPSSVREIRVNIRSHFFLFRLHD